MVRSPVAFSRSSSCRFLPLHPASSEAVPCLLASRFCDSAASPMNQLVNHITPFASSACPHLPSRTRVYPRLSRHAQTAHTAHAATPATPLGSYTCFTLLCTYRVGGLDRPSLDVPAEHPPSLRRRDALFACSFLNRLQQHAARSPEIDR